VPVTGQTLGVLLVGASLGSWLGAASLALYLAQGALGLPFYSGGDAGISFLAASSATGGYLWGFVLAAYAVGRLSERGWDRSPASALGAMLVGEVLLYLVGVPWLAFAVDVSLGEAVRLGLTPFIVADAWKALVAALLLPAAWRLVKPAS
jgi:biotin transport system substrate-specific component